MKKSFHHKLLSFVSLFSILFHSLYTPAVVLAQEATPSPEPIPQPTIEATSTPEASVEPVVSVSPESTETPLASPSETPLVSATPVVEATPLIEASPDIQVIQNTPENSTENNQSEPEVKGSEDENIDVTVTPTPQATPEVDGDSNEGRINAIILPNTKADSLEEFDFEYQESGSATLKTDKADYAPTDTVVITGAGFKASTEYELVITSDTGNFRFSDRVSSDESGALFYTYQLDGTYRPNYLVEVFLDEVFITSLTFTDSIGTELTKGDIQGQKKDGTWVQGNLCSGGGSCYSEGEEVKHRMLFDKLTSSSSYWFLISHDYQCKSDGTLGYVEFNDISGTVGANSTSLIYRSDLSNINEHIWEVAFTAMADTAEIRWDALLSQSAGGCSGSDLHAYYNSGGKQSVQLPVREIIELPDITVVKNIDRNGDGTFESTASANEYCFTLDGGNCIPTDSAGQVLFQNVTPDGNHTITETQLDFSQGVYQFGNGNGSSQNCTFVGQTATANVNAGATPTNATCVFNNQPASVNLTVKKNLDSDNDGQTDQENVLTWTWDLDDGNQNYQTGSTQSVQIGLHMISEDPQDDWHVANLTCGGQNLGAVISTQVNVPAQGLECVFTNARNTGSVLVHKVLDQDADGSWDGNTDADANTLGFRWQLGTGGDNLMGSKIDGVNTGTYQINETGPSNYHFKGWYDASGQGSCSDPDGTTLPANISVDNDTTTEIYLCNKHDFGTITVDKTTLPGGDSTEFDFSVISPDAGVTEYFKLNDGATPWLMTLPTGGYTLTEETPPSGWFQSNLECTSNLGSISTTPTSPLVNFDLDDGENVNCKFTNTKYGSISGYKFVDADGDISTNDRTTEAGWMIKLLSCTSGDFSACDDINNPYKSTTTVSGGYYIFEDLLPGYYKVVEVLNSGWTQLSSPGNITLEPGEVDDENDFFNFKNISITACKESDPDANINSPEGRTEVSGWQVDLIKNGQTIDDQQVTGLDGCYTWDDLGPGDYGVKEESRVGWLVLDTNTVFNFGVVQSGQPYSHTFVNTELGSLEVTKVVDWSGISPDTSKSFEICIHSDTVHPPSCKSVDYDGGIVSWDNLIPESYDVYETNPGGEWIVTGSPVTLTVNSGLKSTTQINNTLNVGSITVEKQVLPGTNPTTFSFSGELIGTIGNGGTISKSVKPGQYTVTETSPSTSGYRLISISCTDSNSRGVVDTGVATFNIEPGEDVTCTFTNEMRGAVTAHKFEDVNANGTQNAGDDPNVSDWQMYLYSGNDCQGDPFNQGDTDAQGNITFYSLTPGEPYSVQEENRGGWTNTTSVCQNFSVNPGQTETRNFGNYKLSKIQGKKFNDKNGNGVYNGGENYLNNWTINLYQWNNDGETWVSKESFVTGNTGTQGQYKFENLELGDYKVCEVLKTNWKQTFPAGTANNEDINEAERCHEVSITKSGDDHTGLHFGNFKKGVIQGKKYEDANDNSEDDQGVYLDDWTIRLYKEQGRTWNPLDEKITGHTGTTGQYRFDGLDKGTYYICEVLQSGWEQTDPGSAEGVANLSGNTNEAPRCRQVVINESGEENFGRHFGNIQLGKIIIDKVTNPSEDKTKFDFTVKQGETVVGNFDLADQDDTKEVIVKSGKTYGVFEEAKDGWDLTSATCTRQEKQEEPNPSPTPELTFFGLIKEVNAQENGNELEPASLYVLPGDEIFCTFTNTKQVPGIEIEKSNNKPSASAGDTVTYTLKIENTGNVALNNIKITDILPSGFSYVINSADVDKAGETDEPGVSGQILTWEITSLDKKEIITITYDVKIADDQKAAKYTNLAVCTAKYGEEAEDTQEEPTRFALTAAAVFGGSVECNDGVPVSSDVTLGLSNQYGGVLTGQVLGAATELPATGSPTVILFVLLVLLAIGLILRGMGKTKFPLLENLIKNLKKGLKLSVTLLALSLGILTANAKAIIKTTVDISDLPEYTNRDSFTISYTAISDDPGSITAQFYYMKEGGSYSALGGVQNGPSNKYDVTGSIVNESNKKYYFKVVLSSGESDETSTTYDNSGPDAPGDFSKEKLGPTTYKIKWHSPNNDDFATVVVYRGESLDFDANSGNEVARVGGDKDKNYEWVDNGVSPDKDYYYRLRALDKAGNSSGLVGDVYTTQTQQITQGQVAGATTSGRVGILPKEDKGQVLGDDESKSEETSALADQEGSKNIADQVVSFAKDKTKLTVGIIILVVGAGILGFRFYKKRKTS